MYARINVNINFISPDRYFTMLHIPPELCIECRGTKALCGLAYCPVMVKMKIKPLTLNISSEIQGSSPPSVFVGRIGYPKVMVGPMLPPIFDDTTSYDMPELWQNYKLDDILHFRLSLVRGTTLVDVKDAKKETGIIPSMQELAMADKPVDSDMLLKKDPTKTVHLNEHIPPFGPSGQMFKFNVSGNVSVDQRIEKAYYDRDLKAGEAVVQLYQKSVPLSKIQRSFSVGSFGKARRLVPTRWSITAVDDITSKSLIERVKMQQEIGEFLVYTRKIHMNVFTAIVIPGVWGFEWIEAWFPNTTWNLMQYGDPAMMGDNEGYTGIDHYAKVGGCYYSARLTAAEMLNRLQRQGTVLMLREIYPGFNIPLGVWFVREQLRAMLDSRPYRFGSIEKALEFALNNLTIPIHKWIAKSRILQDTMYQKKIIEYT
ncbi:MAG: Nre family DNA repair protein [Nitrososphaerales archaeon]